MGTNSGNAERQTSAAAARKAKSAGAVKRRSGTSVGRIGRARNGAREVGTRPPTVLAQLANIERDGGDGILQFETGATLAVTSLDKRYWPDAGFTKGDLMRYYARVAPVLLPALAERPLALQRYPDGIAGHVFYQQNAGDHVPDAVRTASVAVKGAGTGPRFIGGDLPTLLYTVQLGSIAVNAWHSRVGALAWPDYAVIDLDPGPKAPFTRIVEVARLVHHELDRLGLGAALKTSGSRGLHIVVPLPRRTSYDAAAALAEAVAERVVAAAPAMATVERSIHQRDPGAVYVDHLQNAGGKTLASVLSARAKPGATVSMPLSWRALTSRLNAAAFTIATAPGRLTRAAPAWERVLEEGNAASAVRAAVRGARLQGARGDGRR